VWITDYFFYVDKMEAETLTYIDEKLYFFFIMTPETQNSKLGLINCIAYFGLLYFEMFLRFCDVSLCDCHVLATLCMNWYKTCVIQEVLKAGKSVSFILK
jgi:hypothetical protein